MKKAAFCGLAIAAMIAAQAGAATITQWDFNSVPPDGATTTGTLTPAVGAGTATLGGGITATFATGSPGDTAPSDDSGWNTAAYPAAGTGNKTAGPQFAVSTAGYMDITVAWEQRHSNTASKFVRAQYTTDGVNWIDADLFEATAPDTFFARTVDLSAIAAVDDNASFGFRVVAEFDAATGDYSATRTSTPTTYSPNGTHRFDMVTISGTVIPEPASLALLALGSLLIFRRR